METRIARQGWIILIGVPALFFLAYIIAASPALMGLPLCTVKMFTGVDCPGCGLTRSIAFLTHGQIRRSIDLNPMGTLIALWLSYLFAREASCIMAGRQLNALLTQKGRDVILYAFLSALIIQWLFKLYFLLFTFHF